MPWISDKSFEAFSNCLPQIVAQNDRIVRLLDDWDRSVFQGVKRMEEELKLLAAALAEDRNVNSSAYKLIQELAIKVENITATIPPQYRNRLIELTEELKKNNADLAAGVAANTVAAGEPAIGPVPAPEPIVATPDAGPSPVEPPPTTDTPPQT